MGRWFKIPKYIVKTDIPGYEIVVITGNKEKAKEKLKEKHNIDESVDIQVREVFEYGDFISIKDDNDANI